MYKSKISLISILALSFLVQSYQCMNPENAEARGGGRGGGFRGGGFRGGGFGYRGGGGFRGGYTPGGNLWGSGHSNAGVRGAGLNRPGYNNRPSYGRGPANNYNRASDRQRVASANQSYNWGRSKLPTDIGMSRAAARSPRINPHRTTPVSRQALNTRGAAVRRAFNHRNCFRRNFWRRYNYGWWYPGWYDYWAWDYYDYDDLCSYWDDADCSDKPVEYAYGNSIRYSGDKVYYGNKQAATAGDYYVQAQTLATSVPLSSKEMPKEKEWKPMGVFSLTQGDQTNSNSIFQLASNKQGIVRGNFYNPLTDDLKPVQGKIDMKTKRVAWTIGDNKQVVYDTGLANLLSNQSTLLIHFGKEQTQQWDLVRINKEQEASKKQETKPSQ